MKIAAIAFTDRGQQWQEQLGFPVDRGIPVMQWAAHRFQDSDALLFIGACGIAVRAVAPHVRSKTADPAVVVMDEAGQFVIPLLSGHIGGANELAQRIAILTGATPVLTTATDVNGLPAIDVWAVKHDCAIENPGGIRPVSAAVLAGKTVGVMVTERTLTPPFPVTLVLRPRTLVIGVGCKRNTEPALMEEAILGFLQQCGVSLLSVKAISTIDIKAREMALMTFCEKYKLPLLTYSAEELNAVPGVFAHSDFVMKTVGVGCVCERAAVKASDGGRLLMGKTARDGITLALAGEENI